MFSFSLVLLLTLIPYAIGHAQEHCQRHSSFLDFKKTQSPDLHAQLDTLTERLRRELGVPEPRGWSTRMGRMDFTR
jgi:hypothetical protein